jgi:hypothetical protein
LGTLELHRKELAHALKAALPENGPRSGIGPIRLGTAHLTK